MSYLDLNIKNKKKLKKESNLILFPKTYKKIIQFNDISNNKKYNAKSPNNNNFKFIMNKPKEKKETDNFNVLNEKKFILNLINENKLPKIVNSRSNLERIMKHNLSATEGTNNRLDLDDGNTKMNKSNILNSQDKNNIKINDYSTKNLKDKNLYFNKKICLKKQLSEINNTYNNLYVCNNNNSNRIKDNEYLKTQLNYNDNNKKNIFNKNSETSNLIGNPFKKTSNPLCLHFNTNSKLKNKDENSSNDNNISNISNISKNINKKTSKINEYYNLLSNNYKNNEPISIRSLYSKEEKNNNNKSNNIKNSPEELHFFYILMVQEGKKTK